MNSKHRIVLAKSPLRISLAGGGTDITSYAAQFGGEVIGFAINRFVSVTIYPRSLLKGIIIKDENIEYSKNVKNLKHSFFKATLDKLGITNNIQISTLSDVPSGTGLGGSAAFLVSLINAYKDKNISKKKLAEIAGNIEIKTLKLPVGKQDHYLASLGGLKSMIFHRNMEVSVQSIEPGKKCRKYFRDQLLLFYSGKRRIASKILSDQSKKTQDGNINVINSLHEIKKLVKPMKKAIIEDTPELIGPILDEHWAIKSTLSNSSVNRNFAKIYSQIKSHGVDGGKILGAGGGGFFLVSVKKGKENDIRKIMKDYGLCELKFDIETSGSNKISLTL